MTMANIPLLSIQNLRVSLETAHGQVEALRGLNFDMQRGEKIGLIGESGCGKSLTALAIMGLLPARSQVQGAIALNGAQLIGMPDEDMCKIRGARIGMIFQEPMTALNPLQTIGHQIAEPLLLHQSMAVSAAKLRALELLERVQLPRAKERLLAYPHQLSGGQRQRVMIAMALACQPDLLIADEPTTALDVSVQKDVLALISKLVSEEGMGLLFISHDLGVMRDQVDRVMVMYGGAVVESASTEALFQTRLHPYTQGLFAARPQLGLKRGTRLSTIPGQVPELSNWPGACAFADRCAHVQASCRDALPALVQVSEPLHFVRCPQWESIGVSQ
jgi:peptide/nickel transport system ATP-binding protein